MSKPVRITRSRQHKQNSPNGLEIKYVGRPTNYGNPYEVDVWGRELAMRKYRDYLTKAIKDGKIDLAPLKGKNLSCWCSQNEKCHADVLLELANS